VRVIEYQNRDLPHAHTVLALENMPSSETDTKLWINKHTSTEGTDFGGDEKLKLLATLWICFLE